MYAFEKTIHKLIQEFTVDGDRVTANIVSPNMNVILKKTYRIFDVNNKSSFDRGMFWNYDYNTIDFLKIEAHDRFKDEGCPRRLIEFMQTNIDKNIYIENISEKSFAYYCEKNNFVYYHAANAYFKLINNIVETESAISFDSIDKIINIEQVISNTDNKVITEQSTNDNITRTEHLRLENILKDSCKKIFLKVGRENAKFDWNSYKYNKMRFCLEDVVEQVVLRECKILIKAAKIKPSIQKTLDDIKSLKKESRKELAGELKSTRNNIRLLNNKLITIQKELQFHTNSVDSYKFCNNINKIDVFNKYPKIPPPTLQPDKDGKGLPNDSGIYFFWNDGVVVYVGQSINIANRVKLGSHHALKEDDAISYTLIDKHYITWAENFYIGVLQPIRNYGQSGSHNKHKKPENITETYMDDTFDKSVRMNITPDT